MGTRMKAIVRDAYGSVEVLRLAEIDHAGRGRGRGIGARACGGRRPRRLAPDDRYAVRDAPGGLRTPRSEKPAPWVRRGRTRRGGRGAGDRVSAGGRGVRYLPRVLRRVRSRSRRSPRAEAGQRELRAGRGRPDLRLRGAAGGPRPWRRPPRAASADHRCGRRRRDVRRAAREGVRRRGYRRLQRCEDRAGALDRRRLRDRLHPRGFRRWSQPVRRHPRHRRQPLAFPAPAGAYAEGDARDRRRRGRRQLARASAVSCGPRRSRRSSGRSSAPSSRRSAGRTRRSCGRCSKPARSRLSSTGRSRST